MTIALAAPLLLHESGYAVTVRLGRGLIVNITVSDDANKVQLLPKRQVYFLPVIPIVAPVMVKVAVVTPLYPPELLRFTPLALHWYCAELFALTLKEVVPPKQTDLFVGWVLMTIAFGLLLQTKLIAFVEVQFPNWPLTFNPDAQKRFRSAFKIRLCL